MTHTSARGNTHTSHTRAPTAPRLNENTTSITSPTQTHQILQHSKAKRTTIFNNGRYTTNFPQTPTYTVTTTDIKTNMRHIHTSIVSRHLATRGNNKILREPPPQISSSEEILPASLVAPLLNSKQINFPSSNHTYTKSTLNTSITTSQTRHTSSLQLQPHTHHIVCVRDVMNVMFSVCIVRRGAVGDRVWGV